MATIGTVTPQRFFTRRPALTYFLLTFALSWTGVLLLVAPGGIPGSTAELDRLFPVVYLAMLVGPSVAGILLTGIADGRQGLHELLSRLLHWRVPVRWFAVALLTAPLLSAAALAGLSIFSPAFVPTLFTAEDRSSQLLFGIGVALGAGFFEELGWTGFATPALRKRFDVLATGLIVGALWGAWHLLVNFWGSGDAAGALSMELLLPSLLFSVVVLPAYRVLMVVVYDRTRSLLVAMLMHASLTATAVLIAPATANGSLLIQDGVFAIALVAAGRRLVRPSAV